MSSVRSKRHIRRWKAEFLATPTHIVQSQSHFGTAPLPVDIDVEQLDSMVSNPFDEGTDQPEDDSTEDDSPESHDDECYPPEMEHLFKYMVVHDTYSDE